MSNYLKQLTEALIEATVSVSKTNMPNALDEKSNLSFADAVRLQDDLKYALDAANDLKKELQKGYDISRHTRLPNIMERDDIENGKVAGVGSVSLTTDLHASIKAGMQPYAFEWLNDHGHGELIKETVNSSTLKAFIKGEIQKGEEVPEELFNHSVFTRAQIRRSK